MNKHTIAYLLATSLTVTALSACATTQQTAKTSDQITQTYVSDGYHKRTQGYDWVAVETTKNANNTLQVKIRSRIDKKKPTCTFDGIAYPTDNNLYQLKSGDMTLNLKLTTDSVEIAPAQDSDQTKAMTYCSGGGSLIGIYKQVIQLDRTGLDNTKFTQTLSLQNIRFFIDHKEDVVRIRSSGLAHEFDENYSIKGWRITHAETEDMNRDGYPELLIYLQNVHEPYEGDVLAFSANRNQSLSQMSFTPTKDNPDLYPYYRGGDEFSLVEYQLVQRFDEYINGIATGRIIQLAYEVQDGEASRQLVRVK